MRSPAFEDIIYIRVNAPQIFVQTGTGPSTPLLDWNPEFSIIVSNRKWCFLVSLVQQISCIGFTVMFLSFLPPLRFFYFSKPNIYLQFATLLTNVRYFSSLNLGLEKGIHRSFVWRCCHEISSRIQRTFRSQWYGMLNISSWDTLFSAGIRTQRDSVNYCEQIQ